MMNEELLKKITEIMDQFLKEELGNRLSQFAMIALKEIILNEVNAPRSKATELLRSKT